ncbi:Lacal_2735 family protein [Mariniflexile sp.]|uniref:Lacal_2735 family protein n=1 Tax=Mariniflexile sp. TaxID=1979402 RepID=UPI003565DF08
MFNFFKKKKSEIEILEARFKKLMQEWHELSSVNRRLSDEKFAMAQALLPKIDQLKNRR